MKSKLHYETAWLLFIGPLSWPRVWLSLHGPGSLETAAHDLRGQSLPLVLTGGCGTQAASVPYLSAALHISEPVTVPHLRGEDGDSFHTPTL